MADADGIVFCQGLGDQLDIRGNVPVEFDDNRRCGSFLEVRGLVVLWLCLLLLHNTHDNRIRRYGCPPKRQCPWQQTWIRYIRADIYSLWSRDRCRIAQSSRSEIRHDEHWGWETRRGRGFTGIVKLFPFRHERWMSGIVNANFLIKWWFFLIHFCAKAAQGAVRLEGDVITANGSILSGQMGTQGDTISLYDDASVCSCKCSGFYRKRRRPRFTVRRSPGKISHLLPMQQFPETSYRGELLRPPVIAPLLQLPPIYQHRASIWRTPSVNTLPILSLKLQHQSRRASV